MFYQPQKDSYLLDSVIREHSLKDVQTAVDLGCGSGILTKALIETYPNADVHAVDCNEAALSHTQKENPTARVYKSDIFSDIDTTTRFDVIVCNPPYLPAHRLDPDDALTRALVGGKKGYEYVFQVILQAQHYLSENGVLYLLISNLTKPQMVEKELTEKCFAFSIVKQEYIGMFETLFVYKIWRYPQYSQLQSLGVTDITYLAKGKHGMVWKGVFKGRDVACKFSHAHSIVKEAHFLSRVNALGIGPKMLATFQTGVVMEYVRGKTIKEVFENATMSQKRVLCLKVLRQLHALDLAGIEKKELTNPYKHILINGLSITLIDFERCVLRSRPKNVTQFIQYCKRQGLCETITREHLEAYKQTLANTEFLAICRRV
ncbi:MAG: methyltransferase [Candidatus Woesearchaeota archaeon]